MGWTPVCDIPLRERGRQPRAGRPRAADIRHEADRRQTTQDPLERHRRVSALIAAGRPCHSCRSRASFGRFRPIADSVQAFEMAAGAPAGEVKMQIRMGLAGA